MIQSLRNTIVACVLALAGTCAVQAEEASYIVHLESSANAASVRSQLNADLGRELKVVREYRHVINGFSTLMDDVEASRLSRHPGVQAVIKDEVFELLTPSLSPRELTELTATVERNGAGGSGDPVVDLIRANEVWDGSATNDSGHLGEGVVIGITGTGISGSHPAFAATGDDGYTHTNPLGDGVYLGECLTAPEVLCNSKLIGRYTFSNDSQLTSEELDGASNSAASQAAGNRLSETSLGNIGLPIVTGVAPHANLIVYRTCESSCAATSVLSAFEQAINDDVDVLVHFIGSSISTAWDGLYGLAGLSLRANGVSLAYITGNGGPEPGTLGLSLAAPWTATFISSTHGRTNNFKVLTNFSGGDTPPPGDLLGGSLGGPITANIVYAGSLDVPVADPAQCLEPFPPGTLNGEILVCDRGQIARIQKAQNALDSGAGGMVLANVVGGFDSVHADFFPFPGIHLNAADSTLLRTWLASGSGHAASITLNDAPIDPELADRVSGASSRGPVLGLDYLAPSVAVPSIDVIVPTGEASFKVATGPAAGPGGGAIALIKSARPDWSDAEVLSALMTTGVGPLDEQFEDDPTTPFDYGGGRIDVAAAVQAGLLLNETIAGFEAANPAQGGQPSRMNLAGLVDLNCVNECSWSRTVKAVAPASWTVVVETDQAGPIVSAIPQSFTLDAGEEQAIDVVFDMASAQDGPYYGSVLLVPDAVGLSPTRLTLGVAAQADSDLDGVANTADNCLDRANSDQRDSNADGFGNACDTDLNDDQVTNFVDIALFAQRFQSDDEDADFNGDGKVDFLDFELLGEFFLLPPGPSGLL